MFLFSENLAVYDIMWTNMAQPERVQVTVQYGACALRTG
jgi:hypothetical protein